MAIEKIKAQNWRSDSIWVFGNELFFPFNGKQYIEFGKTVCYF